MTTTDQFGPFLYHVLTDANIGEIAAMTTAFLGTLEPGSVAQIQKFAAASERSGDEDSDFVARHDAMLAGIAAYDQQSR